MPLEHRERIGLADARVVRDLVVAHERGVADRHALDDVGHQQRRDEVAHHHGDRGADERVQAAPVDMRGAAAALASGRPSLVRDVGERQHDRAQEPVGVGEVGEQVSGLRSSAVADDAHRGRAAWRFAREHVSPARARCGQQALAGRSPPLDLGRVGGMIGDQRAAGLLLIPAEGGHVPVASEQQAGLARPRLGGEVALPAQDSVCAPETASARSWARVRHARASRSTPSPSPSISNRITPGTSVRLSRRVRRHASPDHAQMAGVAVDVEERRDEHRHQRPVRTRSPRLRRTADVLPSTAVERERDRAGAEDERAQPEGEDRERQRQARENRPQDRVDERHRDGDEHRGAEGERFDTGQERGSRPPAAGAGLPAAPAPGSRTPRAAAKPLIALPGVAPVDRCRHLVATFSRMADGAVAARRAGASADRIVFLGHATVLIESGRRAPAHRPAAAFSRRTPAPPDPAGRQERDGRPRCGADLTPAPRSPRPGLAAAARSRYATARAGRRRRVAAPPPVHDGDRAGAWARSANVGALAVTAVEARHDGRRRRAARAPRRSATSCAAGVRSTSLETPSSSRDVQPLIGGSTSRCYPSRDGGQRSAPATWTHSTPHARPACCSRASRFRCTGEPCCRSASSAAARRGLETRRTSSPSTSRAWPRTSRSES